MFASAGVGGGRWILAEGRVDRTRPAVSTIQSGVPVLVVGPGASGLEGGQKPPCEEECSEKLRRLPRRLLI